MFDTLLPPLAKPADTKYITVQPKVALQVKATQLNSGRTVWYPLYADSVYDALPVEEKFQIYHSGFLTEPISAESLDRISEKRDTPLSMIAFAVLMVVIFSSPFWLPDLVKKYTKVND